MISRISATSAAPAPGSLSYNLPVMRRAPRRRPLQRPAIAAEGGNGAGQYAAGILAEAVEELRQEGQRSADPDIRHSLAVLLLKQYDMYGDRSAVTEAFEVLGPADDLAAPGDAAGVRGAALTAKYEITGDVRYLDQAIGLLSSPAPAEADAAASTRRTALAQALERRADETGRATDASAAVTSYRAALAESETGTADHASLTGNLANALLTHYSLSGQENLVAEAIACLRTAAAGLAPDEPRRSSVLSSLGDALLTTFGLTGDMDVLTEAVAVGRDAVESAVAGAPGLPGYLLNLANSLEEMADATGNVGFLDEAVAVARESVTADPPQQARRGLLFSGLANCLRARYEASGELRDLEAAIAADTQAVDVTSDDDSDRASFQQNLAISLTLRHEHTADLPTLHAALAHARAAVAITRKDDPGRHRCLLTLGRIEYTLFLETEERDSLERAIEAERAARRQLADDHPYVATCLANLAASLIIHYQHYAHADELDEAIQALFEAIALTPDDRPERAIYLYNLGEAKATWAAAQPGPDDLAEAIGAFRESSAVLNATPVLRAESAMEWGRLAARSQDWETAATGFAAAIALFPLVSPRHFERGDQEHQLATFTGLGSDAVACVLAMDRPDPVRAVTLLEYGRGVLIGHQLGISADLTQVRTVAPRLADDFERLRDALDWSGSADEGTGRRELLRRIELVIGKIRDLPGMSGFARPPAPGQLLAAGTAGPVVIVNVSQYRCDALIIEGSAVRALPLPGLTHDGVTEITRAYLQLLDQVSEPAALLAREQAPGGMRDICGWLWDRVARPVLDELGLRPRDRDWPRIWWCPTGRLALLPLHAAFRRYPGQDVTEGVADRVVSSYTATVRMLITLRERGRPRPGTARPLIVAMADTPGLPSLPRVDAEVDALAGTSPEVLRDAAATRRVFQAALPRHPWLHFAGHSRQDLHQPGRAELCVHDGGLAAGSIAGLHLSGGELAYLSCCESAAAGTDLPDEPLHLALAFQMAGFRNVIATLWPVSDIVSARVARAVYDRIAGSGQIDGDDASLALHEAVCALRAPISCECLGGLHPRRGLRQRPGDSPDRVGRWRAVHRAPVNRHCGVFPAAFR